GVLQGIGLGVMLAMVILIYLVSHPQGAELGQPPGSEAYRDIKLHPEGSTFPGLLIWRIGGDLFFASIGHTSTALRASLAVRPEVKRVLLDFAPVNDIDISACDELLNVIKGAAEQRHHRCLLTRARRRPRRHARCRDRGDRRT